MLILSLNHLNFNASFTSKCFAMPDSTSPKWFLETEYLQSCNCDYGCPCNYNALPTYGNCEALIAYHIRKGNFGDVKLDGINFAWGLWWPKAIHMGEGIGKVFVDKKASPQQVKAIEEITSGKHGGGVFAIFPSTLKTTLPTTVTNIEFHFDPYNGSFSVEGAGKMQGGHITNAKTGAKWEGELFIPGGFGFKRGTYMSVNWNLNTNGIIPLKYEKRHGHASVTSFSNEGCIA